MLIPENVITVVREEDAVGARFSVSVRRTVHLVSYPFAAVKVNSLFVTPSDGVNTRLSQSLSLSLVLFSIAYPSTVRVPSLSSGRELTVIEAYEDKPV